MINKPLSGIKLAIHCCSIVNKILELDKPDQDDIFVLTANIAHLYTVLKQSIYSVEEKIIPDAVIKSAVLKFKQLETEEQCLNFYRELLDTGKKFPIPIDGEKYGL